MSRPADAILHLQRASRSLPDVIAQLSNFGQAAHLLGLFERYFPKDFARYPVIWSKPETVERAIEKFFHCAQFLFPIHCPMDWGFGDEGMLDLSSMFFYAPWPAWYEDGVEISALSTLILEETGYHIADAPHGQEYQPKEINWDALDELCAGKRAPLKFVTESVEFVVKGTGNIFCDLTDEEVCNCTDWPEWTIENIDYFAEQWREAQVIYGHFRHLQDWVSKAPGRMQTVRNLIRKAAKTPARRIRVGAPLANVLPFNDEAEYEFQD